MLVSIKILSKLFNAEFKEIKLHCGHLLKKKLYFKYLDGLGREKVINIILNKILIDTQIIASKGRKKNGKMVGKNLLQNIKKQKKN